MRTNTIQVFNYEGLFLLSYFHHRNGKVYVGNLRKKKWIKNPEKKENTSKLPAGQLVLN